MLKLRVKTLPFDPKLMHFEVTCGFEFLLGIPFQAKGYFHDCSNVMNPGQESTNDHRPCSTRARTPGARNYRGYEMITDALTKINCKQGRYDYGKCRATFWIWNVISRLGCAHPLNMFCFGGCESSKLFLSEGSPIFGGTEFP